MTAITNRVFFTLWIQQHCEWVGVIPLQPSLVCRHAKYGRNTHKGVLYFAYGFAAKYEICVYGQTWCLMFSKSCVDASNQLLESSVVAF